ncbi:unnamed protein product [Cuscuta europaea]|uniref:H/ACA ribonucleoprotein complex subunit n=1 Tax=Cuscuta europaea TaxID=41803 RepID=A0A9P0ZMI0_CUSEU|nr:unnamed protein product [Cuscuta europaea]
MKIEGPPSDVIQVFAFMHACEGDAVTKLTNEKIMYFNAPIYMQNKTHIGKMDEIFSPISESLISIKMMERIIASSYSSGDKFHIDPVKLLPLARSFHCPKDIHTPPMHMVETVVEEGEEEDVVEAVASVVKVPMWMWTTKGSWWF